METSTLLILIYISSFVFIFLVILIVYLLHRWLKYGTGAYYIIAFRNILSEDHQIRTRKNNEFYGLDESFYKNITNDLNRVKLRYVSDDVDEKLLKNSPGMKTFKRIYLDYECTVLIIFYHLNTYHPFFDELRSKGLIEVDEIFPTIELVSHFSRGVFMVTTTGLIHTVKMPSPNLVMNYLPPNKNIYKLLTAHAEKSLEVLEQNPGLKLRQVLPISECTQGVQANLQKLKDEVFVNVSYNNPEEFVRVAERTKIFHHQFEQQSKIQETK